MITGVKKTPLLALHTVQGRMDPNPNVLATSEWMLRAKVAQYEVTAVVVGVYPMDSGHSSQYIMSGFLFFWRTVLEGHDFSW